MRRHARPLRSLADRRAAHRQRAHRAVQLAARARRTAASSCCASRTPTASARRPRTSSRSSTRSTGSGIDWDEGPIFQSERADRHARGRRAAARRRPRLPLDGRPRRRQGLQGGARRRPRLPRRADEGEGAVRLRVPDEGVTVVHDVIRGETAFENALLDDLVIARADGTPVYHLAVVVDDPDAGITHVVRGADHYSNTPKQMLDPTRRWARRRPSTRTCRCCTGRTARSSPSATAPRRCRSCARPATCPRRCSTTSRCSAGATTTTTTFFTVDELQERFSARAGLQGPGRVRRAEAALDERALPARALRRGPDGAPGGLHRPHRAARRRGDHAGQDLRRWRSSGRSHARSSRARSTIRRRARRCSASPRRATRSSRGARRWASFPSRGRRSRSSASLRDAVEQLGPQGQAGLPASSGRIDWNDRLTGYLRDSRAAGPRRNVGTGGRGVARATGCLSRTASPRPALNRSPPLPIRPRGGHPLTGSSTPDRPSFDRPSHATTAPTHPGTATPAALAAPRRAVPPAPALRGRRPLAQRGPRQAADRRLRGARGLPGPGRVPQPPARARHRGAPLDR